MWIEDTSLLYCNPLTWLRNGLMTASSICSCKAIQSDPDSNEIELKKVKFQQMGY